MKSAATAFRSQFSSVCIDVVQTSVAARTAGKVQNIVSGNNISSPSQYNRKGVISGRFILATARANQSNLNEN